MNICQAGEIRDGLMAGTEYSAIGEDLCKGHARYRIEWSAGEWILVREEHEYTDFVHSRITKTEVRYRTEHAGLAAMMFLHHVPRPSCIVGWSRGGR